VPRVSIIVVNFRTPTQIKLCLRSLRRYTQADAEVIVVDNRSGDASTDYLRGLPWIRLLENEAAEPDHRNALDLGIAVATGDVICILHSDVFVRRDGWLETLLTHMGDDATVVGSQDRLIFPTGPLGRLRARRKRARLEKVWAAKGVSPKIISHCVLYRRALFEEHGQRFDHPQHIDGLYNDCGELIQRYCEDQGLAVKLLRDQDLSPLLWHFEAATLNGVTPRKVATKRRLRAWRFYRRSDVREILANDALDQ
jgi:glycosyltransferase involved in cell wall biosynthesis